MNETRNKQLGPSGTSEPAATHPSASPEPFEPPSIPDLASLTDGRLPGDYQSRYPGSAWLHIAYELLYLLAVLGIAIYGLILLAIEVVLQPAVSLLPAFLGSPPNNTPLLVWAAAGLAGACGGAASALKWLYHTVAKQQWHRDRVVWRIVVPPLSAVLSVFTGLMIVSGLIPFFSGTPFTSPAVGAAFGFFAGFFSDNLLASLQKVAHKVFGTVSD